MGSERTGQAGGDGTDLAGRRVLVVEDGPTVTHGGMPHGADIQTYDDHRIAMAFGVLGALPGNRVQVLGPEVANVSFPGFWDLLDRVEGGPGPAGGMS